MPKSLADGNITLLAFTTPLTTPKALKAADLTEGIAVMGYINKSDYQLRVSGNESISEQEACKKGQGQAVGPEQYEGNLTPFWYLDVDGKPDADAMVVWDLLKEPGTELAFVEIEGLPCGETLADGLMYDYFEATTGSPKAPDSRFEGYSKRSVQLFISNHESGVLVA